MKAPVSLWSVHLAGTSVRQIAPAQCPPLCTPNPYPRRRAWGRGLFKRPGRLSDYHLRSFPRSTFNRLEFLLKFGQPAFLGCDHGQQSLGQVHVAPLITLPLQLVRPQHGVQRPGKYLHDGLVAFGWVVGFQ